jgi:cyclic-di-GMP phosphodiesterase TipF (flagellum assembly factor)
VRALAEQVQAHEAILEDLPARQAAWAVQQFATMPVPPPHDPEELYAPEPEPEPAPPPRAAAKASALDPIKAKLIRRAIESDGIELHLQPVAALAPRRVIQYCAVPYLRDRDGVLLPPSDFVLDARLAGLQPALDAFVLDRSLRVARRLKARERDISLLVHIEAETWIAPAFHADIAKRLDANADLATHLVIGFSQEALYGFGNAEAEILASFGEKGFRFAMTGVRDVDLDAQSLHTLGVRFLRISSERLTDPDLIQSSDLHPADLPGLMRRHGILLVAEGADTETRVADLLDLDVRAAQGAVFGLPRPVRPEIFTGEEIPPQKPAAALVPDRVQGQKPQKPFRSIARRA